MSEVNRFRRGVQWAVGCGVVGAVILGVSIQQAVAFRPSPLDTYQVVTFDQVVGFIFGGGLLIVSGLITLTLWRRHRDRLRRISWAQRKQGPPRVHHSAYDPRSPRNSRPPRPKRERSSKV